MAARKPASVYDVLRVSSPRKIWANSNNRFNHIREPSPMSTQESRPRIGSTSQKRKNSDSGHESSQSYAEVVGSASSADIEACGSGATVREQQAITIAEVKSICDQVTKEIAGSDADPGLLAIMGMMNNAISKLCDAKATSAPEPTIFRPQADMVVLGAISKRPRTARPSPDLRPAPAAGSAPVLADPEPSENRSQIPPEIQRFRDVVRDAERSTLIFNLDMGRVPTINAENMSRKATQALAAMAAKVDNCTGSIPTEETAAILDDVLSANRGIRFYGAATKSYKNPRDALSGSYCTIPVRYEFADKDTRIQAEQILRTTCKVSCATPYPPILRECIKRTIDSIKQDYPDHLVKVSVNLENHCLRVARRLNKESGWLYAKEDIPIPPEALDVRSRIIPESLKVNVPVYSPRRPAQMQTADPGSAMETNG
jgi:hypothetical protein